MTTHLPILFVLIASMLAIVLGSTHAMGDDRDATITRVVLRSTIRLAPDHQELTIADLANISGPQTHSIQDLTFTNLDNILAREWTSIKISTIRDLIEQAPGVHAGSVIIEGSDISITRRPFANDSAKPLNTSILETIKPAGPVLRDQLEQWIYTRPWLESDADSTRIIFSKSKRDQKLLNTPISGRTVILNEIGRSKMVSCEVVIYENDRLIAETTIRFDVQVKRQVRVSTALIRRNELIDDQHTIIETRWLSPMTPIMDPHKSIGQACVKSIDAGSILLVPMLEQPILVKRGKIVSARSLSGSVSVTMSVRALNNGKLGELIELESRDKKSRFTARVSGPGKVVIVQNPAKTSKITKGS